MTIDFTKPIQIKQGDKAVVTVLFHDNRSVYYHVNASGYRNEIAVEVFENLFENVPEKRQIKGFIGLYYDYAGQLRSDFEYHRDEFDVNTKYETIFEINATEGDGL